MALVLRSKQGGLVITELIVWKGKHCSDDGRETVSELEKRFRTSAVHVDQGKENLQFVKALGGRFITRQVRPCLFVDRVVEISKSQLTMSYTLTGLSNYFRCVEFNTLSSTNTRKRSLLY